MRICFVAEANSAHIEKWCGYFLSRGHEVHVISFTKGDIPGAKIHWIDLGLEGEESDLAKLKYLTQGRRIRKLLKEIDADVVNVHYATSYGAAAALSGVRGYALSVWGADIYDFPRRSFLHRSLLQYSLSRADCLFSTSRAMARETRKYNRNKRIEVTPFGVDEKLFSPERRKRAKSLWSGDIGSAEALKAEAPKLEVSELETSKLEVSKLEVSKLAAPLTATSKAEELKDPVEAEKRDRSFQIGLVKKLDPKYGIDVLLNAAALIRQERPDIDLRLVIAGKGPAEEEYHALAEELGLSERVTWTGFIPQEEAARVWADSDVAVIPSTLDSESFGVAAVEAQACGVPVVISDIPGLMEATRPGYTSLVVERKNPRALADAILRLYDDPELCHRLGKNGRRYVLKRYGYQSCFRHIEECLEKLARQK